MDDTIELRKANDDLKKRLSDLEKEHLGFVEQARKQMLIYRKQIHDLEADNKRLQFKIAELEK